MTVPEYIIIKDSSGDIVAYLSPEADGLKDCYVDTRLNGESTLEFLLPADSEKIEEITPECSIWANDRVYMILKDEAIDFVRDEEGKKWATVMAVERWTELDTDYVEPYLSNDPGIPTPADLAVIIVSGGSDLSGGLYAVGSAAHALYAILDGNRDGWTLGTVDVTGTHDIEMEKVSRLALIKGVQETWGGYLVWDSENRTVSLRSGDTWQLYNGFQVRYAKNLKHITKTQNNKLVTKLYPFGENDLDIASVNEGEKFITNTDYTEAMYVGKIRYPDIYDADELLAKATADLSLICSPRYTYKVKIADLRTLPEYSHEDFSIGDMVDIRDSSIGNAQVRLLQHKFNLFKPWDCELEVGDPEERLVELLKASFNTSDYMNSIFNSSGRISGHYVIDGTLSADKIITGQLVVGTNVDLGTAQDSDGVTTIIGNTVDTGYITALGLTVGTEIGQGTAPKVFYSTPTTPYRVDDIWINGTDLKRCKTARATGAYQSSDWELGTNYQNSSGVTTIIGDVVTTGYVNALSVTAGSVAAENITGTYITGKTIRTATSGSARIELNGAGLKSYNSSNKQHGVTISAGDVFQKINFYANDVYVGGLYYDDLGGMRLTAEGNLHLTAVSGSVYLGSASGDSNKILKRSELDARFYTQTASDARYYTQSQCDSKFIEAGTGGTKTISYINATATGIVIWFTDGTNKTITYD